MVDISTGSITSLTASESRDILGVFKYLVSLLIITYIVLEPLQCVF